MVLWHKEPGKSTKQKQRSTHQPEEWTFCILNIHKKVTQDTKHDMQQFWSYQIKIGEAFQNYQILEKIFCSTQKK